MTHLPYWLVMKCKRMAVHRLIRILCKPQKLPLHHGRRIIFERSEGRACSPSIHRATVRAISWWTDGRDSTCTDVTELTSRCGAALWQKSKKKDTVHATVPSLRYTQQRQFRSAASAGSVHVQHSSDLITIYTLVRAETTACHLAKTQQFVIFCRFLGIEANCEGFGVACIQPAALSRAYSILRRLGSSTLPTYGKYCTWDCFTSEKNHKTMSHEGRVDYVVVERASDL